MNMPINSAFLLLEICSRHNIGIGMHNVTMSVKALQAPMTMYVVFTRMQVGSGTVGSQAALMGRHWISSTKNWAVQ